MARRELAPGPGSLRRRDLTLCPLWCPSLPIFLSVAEDGLYCTYYVLVPHNYVSNLNKGMKKQEARYFWHPHVFSASQPQLSARSKLSDDLFHLVRSRYEKHCSNSTAKQNSWTGLATHPSRTRAGVAWDLFTDSASSVGQQEFYHNQYNQYNATRTHCNLLARHRHTEEWLARYPLA